MKIDHILFPVDFSANCLAVNAEVERLAAHFQSDVTLLHVFEVPTSWYGTGDAPLIGAGDILAYRDTEKQRLEQYKIDIRRDRIQRISTEGSAAYQIAHWTRENNVDLVVMGTHGYGPLRRLLLGSVAMKVLHDVECPVWTHPAKAKLRNERGIERILCSVEISAEAVPMLRYAKDLAVDFGASVELVHCVPETDEALAKSFDCELHCALKDWARGEIQGFQDHAGTDFPLHVTDGSIAHDIAAMAEQNHADLVLIGRGKSQSRFGGLRTHAYEIIREVPCPVLSFAMEHQGVVTRPAVAVALA